MVAIVRIAPAGACYRNSSAVCAGLGLKVGAINAAALGPFKK